MDNINAKLIAAGKYSRLNLASLLKRQTVNVS